MEHEDETKMEHSDGTLRWNTKMEHWDGTVRMNTIKQNLNVNMELQEEKLN